MSKGEKPILSVRIDADLLKRLDQMAADADVGRAEIVERCLSIGLYDQESFVAWLKGSVSGPVLQLITHPTVLKALMPLFRGEADPVSMKVRAGVLRNRRNPKVKPVLD